jgi:hypothetical protein
MRSRILLLVAAWALATTTAFGASYKGRHVDGRWFEGRVMNEDFGAYDCQVRFHDDRAMVRFTSLNLQMEGFLEEEAIADPHRITLYDPRRGMYWTLDVFNLGY